MSGVARPGLEVPSPGTFYELRGVRLFARMGGDGPPLLLLHGFTGSAETWSPFWGRFARHRRLVAVDLLGHGRSQAPADPQRYRAEEAVADLLALLDRLGLPRADVLGYSMGGRLALHLAVAAPHRVGALVLESASPGLADPAEREARRRDDEALADWLEAHGLAAFVARWEAQPLFATQARLPEPVRDRLRAQRLAHTPGGLANSLRGMGAGACRPLWDQLPGLALPCLLLAGELDAKYARLAAEMAARLPSAEVALVPEAGHAVHLEQPETFARLVEEFLARRSPLSEEV